MWGQNHVAFYVTQILNFNVIILNTEPEHRLYNCEIHHKYYSNITRVQLP